MRRKPTLLFQLISMVGTVFICLYGIYHFSRKNLLNSYLASDPIMPSHSLSSSPFVLEWNKTFPIGPNTSVKFTARTIPTLATMFQYSDDAIPRYLRVNHSGDFSIREVRIDHTLRFIYIQTTDNIWQGSNNPNLFIHKFDLYKRRIVSVCEVTNNALPKPVKP